MSLGENLRARRIALGLTQKQLGNLIGITQRSVSRYEQNTIVPEENKLQKLADIFGCNVWDLTGINQTGMNLVRKGSNKEQNDSEWSTLKALRKNRNLTQEQLSIMVGISSFKISQYERGVKHPPNHEIIKLAAVLDVPVGYLIKKVIEEESK